MEGLRAERGLWKTALAFSSKNAWETSGQREKVERPLWEKQQLSGTGTQVALVRDDLHILVTGVCTHVCVCPVGVGVHCTRVCRVCMGVCMRVCIVWGCAHMCACQVCMGVGVHCVGCAHVCVRCAWVCACGCALHGVCPHVSGVWGVNVWVCIVWGYTHVCGMGRVALRAEVGLGSCERLGSRHQGSRACTAGMS